VSLKRYRYTGKERDEETGLYYHGARYYAPWLGRWTSADPAGMVDGSGLYNYARCDPISLSDPSGRASTEDNRVAQMTDPQLHGYLKGLSAEARGAFRDSATGAFRNRVQTMLNTYGFGTSYTLPDVKIEEPLPVRDENTWVQVPTCVADHARNIVVRRM
jgi:RHS repeat-associated protein